MKCTNEISLYELMAEYNDISLTKYGRFGYEMMLRDEDGTKMVEEKEIHPFAVDNFADFCERFLNDYKRLNKKDDKNEND